MMDNKLSNPPTCSGYKYPDECPFDGGMHAENNACRECIKDMEDAIRDLDEHMETVTTAALHINSEVWTLPRPARHHILVRAWCYSHWDANEPTPIPEHKQGFMTSRGRFVERQEAARIAFTAGQIKSEKRTLFSEDLW